jgi:3-deoxy-manno-octulosonate cytidylyltransferase (CMP-KDO synthetase)
MTASHTSPQSTIQNPKCIAVIPARFASTRFPGKMLADRTGKPLIQHVWEQAKLAKRVDRVIVATDDQRIVDAVQGFGGEAVMTRSDHTNGTSRIAEIAQTIAAPILINVQGDEPDLDPALIDLAIATLMNGEHLDCPVATIAAPFAPGEDPANPNIVKVVVDRRGRALYFSRALIPFNRDGRSLPGECGPFKHVGLYAYRRAFLQTYVNLPPTTLEQAEKLEQLRTLEHGYAIAVAVAEAHHHGIDTSEQYEAFVQRSRR